MIMNKIEQILSQTEQTELPYGLYLVATDIGNKADITLRALSVLNRVDFVICEERKNGSRLLKQYGIEKPLETLNEHNEKQQSRLIVEKLITSKVSAALISDGGTPLFADPGRFIVEQCHFFNIPVFPVPGASSLMAALMLSGISQGSGQFLYYGFLPANNEERIRSLHALKSRKHTSIVFLETPYRMSRLLNDMSRILGTQRKAMIAYKMTTPEERILTGSLAELIQMTHDLPKGEFVIVLFSELYKRVC